MVANYIIYFTLALFFLYMALKYLSKWLHYHKEGHSIKDSDKNFISKQNNENILPCSKCETRRDMGHFETYLNDLDSNIFSVALLKSGVALRREFVKNTLLLLSRKQPMLRCCVDFRSPNLSYYERPTSFGINKQFAVLKDRYFEPDLRFVNTSHWKIVLEEELSSFRPQKSPNLWRVVLLREQYNNGSYTNTLLFIFNQVIIDRKGMFQFVKDFNHLLCKLANCDFHISDISPLQLQKSTECILKRPSFWKMWLNMFKNRLQNLSRFASPMPQAQMGHTKSDKPIFLTKSLSLLDTGLILNYMSKLKCALSSVFIAAWWKLQKTYGENCGTISRAPVNVVVDFRESLTIPAPLSSLGHHSLSIPLYLETETASKFKSTVKQVDQLLAYSLKHERHLDSIWELQTCNKLREPPRGQFEIADVGRFDLDQVCPFSVEDCYIGASGRANELLTLVIVNNRLHLGLYVASCVDNIHFDNYLNNLVNIVLHQC